MNAVAVCVDGVPAWAKTKGCCVSGLTLMIWRLSLPYSFVWLSISAELYYMCVKLSMQKWNRVVSGGWIYWTVKFRNKLCVWALLQSRRQSKWSKNLVTICRLIRLVIWKAKRQIYLYANTLLTYTPHIMWGNLGIFMISFSANHDTSTPCIWITNNILQVFSPSGATLGPRFNRKY